MTKDEALKLALDALFSSDDFLFDYHDCEPDNEREQGRYEYARTQNKKAIEAIRKILAQPKRKWVGLTDEEKHDCYLRIDIWSRCYEMIEAKLREKNGG